MNRRMAGWQVVALAVAVATASGSVAGAAEQPPLPRPVQGASAPEGRVIVKFKTSAAALRAAPLDAATPSATRAAVQLQSRAEALGARIGRKLLGGRALSDRAQVVMASGIDSAALVAALRADPEVEYAEVDHFRRTLAVPNDPLYGPVAGTSPASGQWYLKAPTASVPSAINAPGAWDLTTGSAQVVVAVLDTGVRLDHPDLASQLVPGYDMVQDVKVANDGGARDADPSDPGDFVVAADRNDPLFSQCDLTASSWHGTQVSGLIGAAANNGLGMTGVAPGVRLLPVRVLGKCGGYDSDIVAGMRWAAGLAVAGTPLNANPARVLNMSLGSESGVECNDVYSDAIAQVTAAGAVIVAAAGNSSGHALGSPANCAGVISVAGLRHAGTKVGFSDAGSDVTIAAPGGNCGSASSTCLYPILSTTNAGTTTPVVGSAAYTNGTDAAVGTSFSAPLVSGTVALMLSVRPTMTPPQVRALLKGSAQPFPPSSNDPSVPVCRAPNGIDQLECHCTTATCGAGMLDVGAAVTAAANGGLLGPVVEAAITATPKRPEPNQTVTLSSANSLVAFGRTVATRTWSIVEGGGIVTGFVDGNSTGLTAAVVPSGPGEFTVRLTVTDDQGLSDSEDLKLKIDVLSATLGRTAEAPEVGESVWLSVENLLKSTGRSVHYGWSITQGGGTVVRIAGATNQSRAQMVAMAPGPYTVQLTLTDDLGKQFVTTWEGVVVASTSAAPVAASSDSGGGRTGFAELLGLLAFAAAALALRRRHRA